MLEGGGFIRESTARPRLCVREACYEGKTGTGEKPIKQGEA